MKDSSRPSSGTWEKHMKKIPQVYERDIWHWVCDKRGLDSKTQEALPAPSPQEYFQIHFTHLFNT